MDCDVCTFHKCGSNWFRRLYREVATLNALNIEVSKPTDNAINTSIFVHSKNTLRLHRNPKPYQVLKDGTADAPILLCMRDPKDVVVSQYWSWKNTHKNNSAKILRYREKLTALSVEDGMLLLIESREFPYLTAMEEWAPVLGKENLHVIRYEDLLSDFAKAFRKSVESLGLHIGEPETQALEEKYSFRNIVKREPGVENTTSHYRKGVSGDWQNYFTDSIAAAFDEHYASLCASLGYDKAVL